MSDYFDTPYDEEDEDDLYLGKFRPIKAKGLPSKRNDRKGYVQHFDWDED